MKIVPDPDWGTLFIYLVLRGEGEPYGLHPFLELSYGHKGCWYEDDLETDDLLTEPEEWI